MAADQSRPFVTKIDLAGLTAATCLRGTVLENLLPLSPATGGRRGFDPIRFWDVTSRLLREDGRSPRVEVVAVRDHPLLERQRSKRGVAIAGRAAL